MKNLFFLVSILCIQFIIESCGGGFMNITANKLEYPVSATNFLIDKDNNFVEVRPQSDTIDGHFEFSETKWYIGWTLFDLTEDPDISEKINSIIKEKGGDAVINLKLFSTQNPLTWLGSIIPIIPTPVIVEISGEVVLSKSN